MSDNLGTEGPPSYDEVVSQRPEYNGDPAYPAQPQGGVSQQPHAPYPTQPQAAYPTQSQGAYPTQPQGPYLSQAQEPTPIRPPEVYPQQPQGVILQTLPIQGGYLGPQTPVMQITSQRMAQQRSIASQGQGAKVCIIFFCIFLFVFFIFLLIAIIASVSGSS